MATRRRAPTLLEDGYARERLFPVENKTVVTDPRKGLQRNNLWETDPATARAAIPPAARSQWPVYKFQSPLLKLNDIFPEGIEIPKIYVGRA